jgi:5-methylcytosine-specific restriction endonuclease McrA
MMTDIWKQIELFPALCEHPLDADESSVQNVMNDPRRIFTPKQSRQKVIECGGLCELCNEPLEDGFHMHHKIPHSIGGRTILSNCLALCPSCHKGLHNGENETVATKLPRRVR